MKYRQLGATDLIVSELGFGCARLGGFFGDLTWSDLIRTLHQARDAGITFFDTADMYCQGESEALIGEAFRTRRHDVIVASKVGYAIPSQRRVLARVKPILRPLAHRLGLRREHLPSGVRGSLTQDFSPGYIVSAAERSLKRLRTDYLDLYQLHSPPRVVLDQGEAFLTLEKLQRQGKIRWYGVSCETTEDAIVCLEHGGSAALQLRLSLLDQSALATVVPRAVEQRTAVIARECFAGGLLARPAAALDLDGREVDVTEQERELHQLKTCERIAREHNRTLAEAAIQFVLGIEDVNVALVGMRTDAHLRANLSLLAAPPMGDAELGAFREAACSASRVLDPLQQEESENVSHA
jgi:aryl-alcohol dehydrogenase-like predicted oxidoreductase